MTALDAKPNAQSLTDAEVDELGEMLVSDWTPEGTMDLEQLDGFLAGLICAPRAVMPSTYVPVIFGEEEIVWPNMETAQRFYSLLMRHWNEIANALNAPIERLDDPRAYVPLLAEWDQSAEGLQQAIAAGEIERLPHYGELWARGFLHAVDLTREDWDEVPEDDEEGAQLIDDALSDILALIPGAGGEESDDDARTTDTSPAERDEMVADAIVAAYALRDYWRDVSFERERVKEPIRREPKIGRNDPCPCGSGKKFKNCHGRGP